MYGIPTYLEANPAPIAIATFPFLFGMMFGDMGHGSLYLLFGAMLIMFNEKLKNGPLAAFCKFRYLLFLMGFFSTYCGALYNEWFSIPT
jgi:V-type H+-transporting ATPase subunit a|tara:strand:- start:1538 stop:1804 length:267 start_codon:yes stop_codon:yes gene_type:complete